MNRLIHWSRNGAADDGNVTPMSETRREFDQLFPRFLDVPWSHTEPSSRGIALDVTESDDEVRVRAEVPGMKPEDLDISLTGQRLTLAGEKVDSSVSRNGDSHYSERYFGSFQRTVKLPCPVEADEVEAEHANGVVTIRMRKSDAVRPKRIQIKSTS